MNKLKRFTIDDIRNLGPCYDPARHLPEDWSGTALDILKHNSIPAHDALWVVCRESILDSRTLRLFAVWCARQVQHLMTDKRSIAALDVAERYARGEASKKELYAARAAASDAANDSIRAPAYAACSATRSSAEYAAYLAANFACQSSTAVCDEAQCGKLAEMLKGERDE